MLSMAALTGNVWADDPIPDIKANGSNEPISITAADNLSITISLNPEQELNNNADWWALASTPFGTYSYVKSLGWQSGVQPMSQEALSELSENQILTGSGLPTGLYNLYFGVDMNMNGSIDPEQLFYDFVTITVRADSVTYPIVDTNQTHCFSDTSPINCGQSHNGQDAQYQGLPPAYQDNADGTVTDLNTGLMWIQDAGERTLYADALEKLKTYQFAGYDDWRLPTIKEIYSLTQFTGLDPTRVSDSSTAEGLKPFIDTDYFVFQYGDETGGNRVIDAQWLTRSIYVSTVFNGTSCFFGFNFADGRIKCYPLQNSNAGGYFAQFVRGGDGYGENQYIDNGNSTITDHATSLTWTQNDNGSGINWADALTYCEDLNLADSNAWRLPNIKELHSIVDYTRSPDTTNSPAIDPLFNLTSITNEAEQLDYPFYWSSTTFISYPNTVRDATYISFGRALGYQEGFDGWIDVHGAGAQRSDDKVSVGDDQQLGNGPQGDARRSSNYALCVTGGSVEPSAGDDVNSLNLPESSAITNNTGTADNLTSPPTDANQSPPDLAVAAATLGISEQTLSQAMGAPPPDLDAAAATLGISVEALRNALGVPTQP